MVLNGFSSDIPDSSTSKTDRHDITEILLKVALSTITLTLIEQVINERTTHVLYHIIEYTSPERDSNSQR
jgi:hypothetical protein